MLSITDLPVEVIELIALHVAIQYPFRAPSQLFYFSLLNRHTHALLAPSNNHQLYANLFRSLFDVGALVRRLRSNPFKLPSLTLASPHPQLQSSNPFSQLCNSLLADAYFERLALFKRMRKFASHPPPVHPTQLRSSDLTPYEPLTRAQHLEHLPANSINRDLWLIYLMILENDGLNWIQLIKAANVTGFLLNYFHYEIYPSATAPGYPVERPEIAIALRLCHLFLDLEDSELEGNYWTSETGIETYLFALKPYTFASHQYDAAYAPCQIRKLPINSTSQKVLTTLSQKLTDREEATFFSPINSDSSDDESSHPLVRAGRLIDSPLSTSTNLSNTDKASSYTDSITGFQPIPKYSELIYMGRSIKILPPLLSHVALLSFFWSNIRHSVTPNGPSTGIDDQMDFFIKMMKKVKTLKSKQYDKEFLRLTSCLNPFESRGLRFDLFQSCIQGGWDGQFGFLDLTSFRQMLAGRLESVYEGRYGDQNQVFKLNEFIVRVRDGQPVEFIGDSRENATKLSSQVDDGDPDGTKSEDANDSLRKGCVEELEEEEPQESLVDHLLSMKSLINPTPVKPILVKYDPSEKYELQVHGAGHSSWGHFQVKGRVRAWDGMLAFLKIYDAGRHGRWLYRGYYSPGDMIVGRWRDTLTSEGSDGYEGTFIMFKRR